MLICITFIALFTILFYQRASLMVATISFTLFFIITIILHGLTFPLFLFGILLFATLLFLNIASWRRRFLSARILKFYRAVMPSMSRTEREAITAGSVTWEGNLFRGNPDWQTLLAFPVATLTSEEQAFMDGPLETLCSMVDDWDITHHRADLPPAIWEFIKTQGFFGLIIPTQYGGKAFSAFAHSQILIKLSGISATLSTTVAVPNSLGPAELLLHYGTEEQKNYYLPKLARGEEVPCFALTSPEAGSDAGAMSDHGIICWGEHDGKKTLGMRLTWEKRYITLAPVATVIGLAFKLYDPDHLIGKKEDVGITCALIPRATPGVVIGRRHFPLNSPFQNGPTSGKDIFIPLDWIIGGVAQAGCGWRMLMECLAAGRAITLPASAVGGMKVLAYTAGAYAQIRRQFHVPIGKFEGVEEPLARIAAATYTGDAARIFAVSSIDRGEKPAVASAIVKYHVTELGRKASCDGMDIHGGKGICLGPKNYLGRSYEYAPIAITVEGANILTRNMIIFGQGVIRCHPFVLAELEAANLPDEQAALIAFDKAVMGHMAFGVSNTVRSLVLGLTSSYLVRAPRGKTKRYFQHMTRFSSALAMTADAAMLILGGNLKRKESISARLGDILSYLYLMSAVIKHYYDQGKEADDFPIIRYICEYYLFEIQERFDELLKNFPARWAAYILRPLIFPVGMHFAKSKDKLNHAIAQLLIAPTATRQRLAAGAFLTATDHNMLAKVQDALIKTLDADPIEKKIKLAEHDEPLAGYSYPEKMQAALTKKIITETEFNLLRQAAEARHEVIAVDDFAMEELARMMPSSAVSIPSHDE